MKLYEYGFSSYYHKIVTIEADELTDLLKEKIEIQEEDCYTLCSCFCDPNGVAKINVLAVGKDWEHCTRGLETEEMLGIFDIEDVLEKEARLVEPDLAMREKNDAFLRTMEQDTDEEVIRLRHDNRLDPLRSEVMPDVVLVGLLVNSGKIVECDLKVNGTEGPYLTGELADDGEDYEAGEPIKALPYLANTSEFRLLGFAIGKDLDDTGRKIMKQVKEITDRYGLSFSGITFRS